VNPRVQHTRDSLHETLLNSLNKSEGSQRASRRDESLIAHVNGYHSVFNAYDTGKKAVLQLRHSCTKLYL
jgi:hypothetical protein